MFKPYIRVLYGQISTHRWFEHIDHVFAASTWFLGGTVHIYLWWSWFSPNHVLRVPFHPHSHVVHLLASSFLAIATIQHWRNSRPESHLSEYSVPRRMQPLWTNPCQWSRGIVFCHCWWNCSAYSREFQHSHIDRQARLLFKNCLSELPCWRSNDNLIRGEMMNTTEVSGYSPINDNIRINYYAARNWHQYRPPPLVSTRWQADDTS